MAESTQQPSRWRNRLRRGAQIVAGTLCGLLLAEVAFRIRDHGAFPHLNCYVADAKYGVRLKPGAETSVRFGGAPATNVRINGAGFRDDNDGPEPPVRADETLFLGDSQTFGLGVEYAETFAVRYAKLTGKPSYNAGVPTWGPPEFERALSEIGERRHPKTVVYVINFANDPFEARRPNTERHTVWDGWAVRRETAPAHVAEFPGRALLFNRSHLFFALRGFWHGRGSNGHQDTERGTPSEGTFRDLLSVGIDAAYQRHEARVETNRRASEYESEVSYAQEAYRAAESHVRAIVWEKLKLGAGGLAGYDPGAQGSVYLAADANPGDIVVPGLGEEGRPVFATAVYIRQAVELRSRFESELRKRIEAGQDSQDAKRVLTALATRDEQRKKLREAREQRLEILRASSPLTQRVLAAQERAKRLGARFVLLVLPLDVMVSPSEWSKYGKAKVDLSSAQILIDDFIRSVRDAGGVALDASEALRQAEPGAFLPADIHMTPKGHDAVAKALVKELNAPTPSAPDLPTLAPAAGRSRIPPPELWDSLGGEIAVNGSGGCPVTKKYREWLYIRCRPASPSSPQGVGLEVTQGGLGETLTWVHDGGMILVAPIPAGNELEAVFSWSNGTSKRLHVTWDAAGSAPELSMTPETGTPAKPPGDPEAAERICACYKSAHPTSDCGNLVANADAACVATYAQDCPRLLACAASDPLVLPRCTAVKAPEQRRCGTNPNAVLSATSLPGPVNEGRRAAGTAVILSAQAFVGPKCQLGADPVALLESVPFDNCPTEQKLVDDYDAALKSFGALAESAPPTGAALTFWTKAKAFDDFIRIALDSEDTRGTAAFLQDLTLAYNAWQPEHPQPVDPPRMIDLYFGLTGNRAIDFYRDVRHTAKERKAAFDASGKHLEWRHGSNGWEGPYLEGDSRTTFSNN